ncbi:MAG: preprotein translocase subunit SecE [Candidatus Peregrinibacteria bacterium]|nr:preprotein translocase subunit SecE [Candidatus Peregrinibacteria bacterium]
MNAIKNYIRTSFEELTKVVWPTKNQAVRLTIIVLVFCVVMAVALAAVDYGFSYLFNLIITRA